MMVEGVGQLDYGVVERGGACGARWGKGTIVLVSKFSTTLVLTSTAPPSKQAGNPAFSPFFGTKRRHHKPPLRGGRLR